MWLLAAVRSEDTLKSVGLGATAPGSRPFGLAAAPQLLLLVVLLPLMLPAPLAVVVAEEAAAAAAAAAMAAVAEAKGECLLRAGAGYAIPGPPDSGRLSTVLASSSSRGAVLLVLGGLSSGAAGTGEAPGRADSGELVRGCLAGGWWSSSRAASALPSELSLEPATAYGASSVVRAGWQWLFRNRLWLFGGGCRC